MVHYTAARSILSRNVSPKKINYSAEQPFAGAKERAGHIPLILKTDCRGPSGAPSGGYSAGPATPNPCISGDVICN